MARSKPKPALKVWTVPVKVTLRGYAVVEAETAEEAEALVASEAEALVASGSFELEPGAEMSDWEQNGKPREDP